MELEYNLPLLFGEGINNQGCQLSLFQGSGVDVGGCCLQGSRGVGGGHEGLGCLGLRDTRADRLPRWDRECTVAGSRSRSWNVRSGVAVHVLFPGTDVFKKGVHVGLGRGSVRGGGERDSRAVSLLSRARVRKWSRRTIVCSDKGQARTGDMGRKAKTHGANYEGKESGRQGAEQEIRHGDVWAR